MPLEVPDTARSVTVVAGVTLLVIGGRLRLGHRRAYWLALGWLSLSAFFHLSKGLDFEEAITVAVVASYLAWNRRHFSVPPSRIPARTVLAALGLATATASIAAIAAIYTSTVRITFGTALLAHMERLVGVSTIDVPSRLERGLAPALGALGATVAAFLVWLSLRPAVEPGGSSVRRLRELFDLAGGDSLTYFALRADKQAFFWRDSAVTYRVFGLVCLVSPDPIGPIDQRDGVWDAFRSHAAETGLVPAVIGAGPDWLDVYRRSGFRSVYLGDEAVVEVASFSLEGRPNKTVREAVNRLRRAGYRTEVVHASDLSATRRAELLELVPQSREGSEERGFSMTLGRMFDPEDREILVSFALDAAGKPAAFCQFVPAPAMAGYSLDVMRRSTAEQHPNGLMDFLIAETALWLQAAGHRALGLNFTILRAVYKGEATGAGNNPIVRYLVRSTSRLAHIEALYRFNDKFHPVWMPRHIVYRSRADLPRVAAAIAEAESLWEIPVLGRLLSRRN